MVGIADDGRERGLQRPAASNMRVSDSERHAVAEVLREAAGEGRIDLDELEERLEATYAAKTYADLVPLTADLPTTATRAKHPAMPPAAGLPAAPAYQTSFAVMSETRRTGVWRVEGSHSAFALMGSVVLDLREAQLTQRETYLNANAVMGGVDIIVGPEVVVVVEGIGVMGEYAESRAKVPAATGPGSPVVRVRGLALMGAVNVKRKARSPRR